MELRYARINFVDIAVIVNRLSISYEKIAMSPKNKNRQLKQFIEEIVDAKEVRRGWAGILV